MKLQFSNDYVNCHLTQAVIWICVDLPVDQVEFYGELVALVIREMNRIKRKEMQYPPPC